MRPRLLLAGLVAMLALGGGALASHVAQVDPATVPTGFLVTHNEVNNVPVSALARATKPSGADIFVQHGRLAEGEMTAWHTHPGPVFVTVVRGTFIYRDSVAGRCRDRSYTAGHGLVDRGFGHVHRGIGGPGGADFYATYILPRGSQTHLVPASAPKACTP
jgi:hypothetical protein